LTVYVVEVGANVLDGSVVLVMEHP
jgi:hypothetical protein